MDAKNLERLEQAMFCESLPCNPRPFLNGLLEYVTSNGTDSIKSQTAKRILWVLLAQAYGSTATIDLMTEFDRLKLEVA